MLKNKLTKTLLVIFSFFLLIFLPAEAFSQSPSVFPDSRIHSQPVIKSGNTSYHDGVGARDPWVIRDGSTYYLYYDCQENLYNPSFESSLGTNGWGAYKASILPSSEQKLFGQNSLKLVTDGTAKAGAFTEAYYYQNNFSPSNLASATGIAVFPGETYIASAYVWVDANTTMGLLVQQFRGNPSQERWAQERLDNQFHSYQTIQGNNNWQRIQVKFTADENANVVTLSLFSPNAVKTTSFWDGIQLERVDPQASSSTEFPQDKEYFNRPIEELLGWRSCVASSQDGVNFTKHGPIKVEGAKGAWENVEKPGWTGSSFMYLNVFKYDGRWYAHYWKGGRQLDFSNQSDTYAFLRTGHPSGLGTTNSPDRTGLAVADSPLGPFRRISQSKPVIEIEDPQGLCNQNTRSDQAAQGKILGCDYLNVNGVPQQIGNQWVVYYAAQTTFQKGEFGGTQGNGKCMVNGITAGFATSQTPLGPWIPSDQNPIFNPDEACTDNGGPGSLEGPIYFKDKSGQHVLFLNAISGGAQSIQAVWADDPLNEWSLQNRKSVISTNQAPGGAGSAINLPTIVETEDGKTLNLYFGFRKNRPEGAPEDMELVSFLFHDIGLLTLPLPLFDTPSKASREVTALGYSIAESLADLPDDINDTRVIKTTSFPVKITHTLPEANTKTTHTLFVRYFYSNGQTATRQQSIIYNPPISPVQDADSEPAVSPSPTPIPSSTSSTLTATSVPTPVTLVGYIVAESASQLPDNIQASGVVQTTNSQITLNYNFPVSATRIVYQIYARFFYSNGKFVTLGPKSVIYNPLDATDIIQTSGTWSGGVPHEIGTYGRNDRSLVANKTFKFTYDGSLRIYAVEINSRGEWDSGPYEKEQNIQIGSGNYLQLILDTPDTSWSNLRLVEVQSENILITPAPTPTTQTRTPSISIWSGEAGVKSTIADNESLTINFNRNVDVNAVNLVIDGAEEGAPTQVTLPLTGGAASITWPNNHTKHIPGQHSIGIKGYYCPDINTKQGCTGSGVDTRSITVTN